jgi:hypothetical protein
MKRITYPSCMKSFTHFCEVHNIISYKKYNQIMKIQPFDVSLSYGLYHLSYNKHKNYKIHDKINLYNNLIEKYNVKDLELGMINLKNFPINKNPINKNPINKNPIFDNTINLLENVEYQYYNIFNKELNNYILIQEYQHLSETKYELIQLLSSGVQNFSFSLSKIYHFQKYYDSTKIKQFNQLYNLLLFLQDLPPLNLYKNIDLYSNEKPFNIRLYIDYDYQTNQSELINHLFYLHKFHIDKICIVDRHGKMKKDDLLFLIEKIKKYFYIHNFSLQFHCNKDNEDIVEELFHIALDYGINEFNVNENILNKHTTCDPNIIPVLNYQTYYKFLTNYLICKG